MDCASGDVGRNYLCGQSLEKYGASLKKEREKETETETEIKGERKKSRKGALYRTGQKSCP